MYVYTLYYSQKVKVVNRLNRNSPGHLVLSLKIFFRPPLQTPILVVDCKVQY